MPMGEYANFAECVAKNQDKSDPEAYCGYIKHKVEGGEVATGELYYLRDFSTEERDRLAKSGHAMPDGSYPIANVQDLRNAIAAFGRAKNPAAVKRHIMKRARALNREDLIPEKWSMEDVNVINEVLMQLGNIGEDGILHDAQLLPIGTWSHPLGTIDVTPERARRFADQYKRNVAGQKLPVLWIHSDKTNVSNPNYGKAAGWFVDMRGDEERGVVVDIQFNPEAIQAIKNKEYSYLSAEYFDKVQLPHHKSPEEDVIVAAALVNRPHLKGMNPLLNEETGHQFLLGSAELPIKGVSPMDQILRQLCEQAKIELSDDQSELTEEQSKTLTDFLEKRDKDAADAVAKVTLLEKQLADKEDPEKVKARNLEEAGFVEEAKLLSEYRADKMVKELSEFVPDGAQLSPATTEIAKQYALEQTPENLTKLHKQLLSKTAVVDLRELGHGGDGGEDDGDGTADTTAAKILEESQKIADEQKISLGEAMSQYSREHPEEWNEYQRSLGATMAELGR